MHGWSNFIKFETGRHWCVLPIHANLHQLSPHCLRQAHNPSSSSWEPLQDLCGNSLTQALSFGSGHPVSTALLTLWHQRLGHISEETVHKMQKMSLTEGMKVEGSGMGDCSACRKGKQT